MALFRRQVLYFLFVQKQTLCFSRDTREDKRWHHGMMAHVVMEKLGLRLSQPS